MSKSAPRIAALLLLGLAIAVPASGQGTGQGTNFVANPGAEDPTPPPPEPPEEGEQPPPPVPPRWSTTGDFTVVAYGSAGFPDSGAAQEIGGDRHFFAGGPINGFGESTAAQTVDVSADAAAIDRGEVQAVLAAAIGGAGANPDAGSVSAQFSGADGLATGQPLKIFPVTPSERGNQTKLVQRSAAAAVPTGTRRIRVLIQTSGSGDYIHAYFDNVSLTLPGATRVPPPVAAPEPVLGAQPSPGGGTGAGAGAEDARLRLPSRPVRISRSGALRLRIACLQRDERCRGRLSLRAGRRGCGSRRVSLPAGRAKTVAVKLGRGCRARVARSRRGIPVRLAFRLAGGEQVSSKLVVRPAIRGRARGR